MTTMTTSAVICFLVTVSLVGAVFGVPEIRVISFDAYCEGRKAVNISLGPCQQHYIACNSAVGNVIGQCPRGQSFNEGKQACMSLESMNPACYDLSVIGLTDITEQLAIATRTCDAGPGLYASFNDTCARQALLCLPNKQPQVITCPRGTYYNPNRLACVPNAIICAYPEGQANIEDALVYAYCNYRPSHTPTTTAITGDQCPTWFVDCETHDVIVCSDGEYYDATKRSCRIPEPSDPCYRAHEDVCTGYEWRAIALGPCSSAFRYCQGRRAIVYTCADETVFDEKSGTCIHPKNVQSCPKCRAGERRALKTNSTDEACKNYLECQPWNDSIWVKVACPAGTFYDADQGRCWKNPAGACSRKPVCNEGTSYRISCGDYVICREGRYVSSSCPHLTRWDTKQKFCLPDASCVRFQRGENVEKSCRPGDIVGRSDCRGYSLCSYSTGKFEEKSCNVRDKNYSHHSFCSTCLQTIQKPKQRVSAIAQLYQEEQISLCSTQTLIILPGCLSAIYCEAGTPREYLCPRGTLFNATNLRCTKDAHCLKPAPNADVIIPKRISFNNNNPYAQPQFNPPPPPPLSEQQIKVYTTNGQDYCIPGRDAFRKSDPIDCGIYHECFNNVYKRRACPANSAFDPTSGQCKTDFKCNPVKPKCEEDKKVGLPKCGKALRCERGAWVRRKCTGNQAFVEGKCRPDVLCDVSKPPPTCVEGSIMAAPASTDCTRYLQCHGGQLYERQCSNGMRFDERYLACSATAPCKAIPVCYDGDVKAHHKLCDKYLTCKDGKFVEQSCPWRHIWDVRAKQCIYGSCVAGRTPYAAVQVPENPIVGGICVEKTGLDGYYHDPNDCRVFYQCASSKWVRKQCGPGTAWSPGVGVCDHIGNVQACRGQTLS